MSSYAPDNWVVLQFLEPTMHYRVLAGWSGGYLNGDSWRLNSGITKVTEVEGVLNFHGATGSVYKCRKTGYCLRKNNAGVWDQIKELKGDSVELLPETTDWLKLV